MLITKITKGKRVLFFMFLSSEKKTQYQVAYSKKKENIWHFFKKQYVAHNYVVFLCIAWRQFSLFYFCLLCWYQIMQCSSQQQLVGCFLPAILLAVCVWFWRQGVSSINHHHSSSFIMISLVDTRSTHVKTSAKKEKMRREVHTTSKTM